MQLQARLRDEEFLNETAREMYEKMGSLSDELGCFD